MRGTAESSSDFKPIRTVVCGKCGQRFGIRDDAPVPSALAERQAAWVTDQLVWDHIQERKHHGTIELPSMA